MSTIKSSTTLTTAYSVEADTTGTLVFQTGATPTTALSIDASQVVTFVNPPNGISSFPTGTLMLFQQTAAPTGWTKQTTHDNKALRVVTGSASSGGTSSFTTVFTNQTPTITTSGLSAGATTLTTAQMPSHTHTYYTYSNGGGNAAGPAVNAVNTYGLNTTTGSTGGGGSHDHTISGTATSSAITLNVQYVDLIIASKN
jgi:hypothetical protein